MSQISSFTSGFGAGVSSIVASVTTVDDTVTTLFTRTLDLNSQMFLDARVMAIQNDNVHGAMSFIFGTALRRAAGTIAIGDFASASESDNNADPAIDLVVVGNDLRITVSGDPAATYNWRAWITIYTF